MMQLLKGRNSLDILLGLVKIVHHLSVLARSELVIQQELLRYQSAERLQHICNSVLVSEILRVRVNNFHHQTRIVPRIVAQRNLIK